MSLPNDSREAIALNWLLDLPLLGAYELSMLMDETEDEAKHLLLQLARTGWLDSRTASSPELEPDRLFSISDAGQAEVSRVIARDGQAANFILRGEEIDECWARVETTVGINRFFCELVWAASRTVNLQALNLRRLPRRRSSTAWWPAGVDAYGCIRSGELFAPFFLAWDRVAAPVYHRRRRLASWSAFRRHAASSWEWELPTILVLCPNGETNGQWAKAVENAAIRSGSAPLPVAIAEIGVVFSADPLESVWRAPLSEVEAPLTELLTWRHPVPEECSPPLVNDLPSSPARQVSLTPDIAMVGERLRQSAYRELGSTEKRILQWLAHHPLLTAGDLSVLVRCRRQLARTLLERLRSAGLIEGVTRRFETDASDETYYFLSHTGLQEMARREGVPFRRLAHYGSIAASMQRGHGAGRLETLLRQFDHTVGTNRFFVQLVGKCANHGAQVIAWLSATDAAMSLSKEDGRWIRPDGAADLKWGQEIFRISLEFDRGTMRSPQMGDKLRRYAAYFQSVEREEMKARRECVLFITTSATREAEIVARFHSFFASNRVSSNLLLTSTLPLIQRQGPFARVWRTSEGTRLPLLEGVGIAWRAAG